MISMHPGGFGFFGAVPLMFFLVFGLVLAILVGSLVQSARRNRRNNNSPRITSEAEVVTKRTHVWGDHSHTDYYATFQFESGDRIELQMAGHEFGLIIEGDKGKLTFQGTRFLGFERIL